MSWTHSRQNGSLTSPLSQATSHPSQVVQNNSTTTSGFGHQHQQWPQATNYNQNLQQQPIPSNNWFNPTGQTVTQKIVSNPSQDWQQQPLQPPSICTNTQYFPKQQQPTKPVENYQNQSFSTNFQQNSQQRSKNLNSNVNTQQKMSSQIQNNELFDQKTSNTDNWGDWGEWNDNNNPSLNNVNNQQQPQQLPINSQNIIEESFHNELNDNWSWNVDKNSSTGSVISQMADNKKIDVYNNGLENEMNNIISNFEDINFEQSGGETGSSQLGYIQNIQQTAPPFNQKQQQSSPPVLVHSPKQIINEQTVHSSPVNSHEHKNLPTSQLEQQTSSNDNSQNPVGSPVYVTQAKPVAQPSRQYALTPLTDPGDISSSVKQLLHNQQSSVLPNPTSSSPQSPPQTIGQVRQYTIQSGGIEHPGNSNSPGIGNLPPPPPPIVQNSLPVASTTNNPYKRAGAAQHHRNVAVAPPKTKQQSNVIPPQFYAPTLPDDFLKQQHNQEYLAPDNSEVIVDRTFEVENLEVAPNNDRNQYLQTGHLSEEGYNIHNIGGNINDQNNEFDNFPPPGLSRLVLGEPETSDTAQQHIDNQPEIPPGFDRMIPGTELVASDLNMVRQADGQDTIPSPRSAFTAVQRTEINDTSSNMDITTDRNLYLVPGDESDVHEHRVVTGVENGPNIQGTEQREIELDGENLEDQQQPQHQHPNHIDITRDEPLEGANTMDPPNNSPGVNHETESSLTVEMNLRDISNPSTGNDDSDHRDRPSSYFGKSNLRRTEEKRRRADHNDNGNTDKRKDKYETEESDLSSEKERRRYREGSVRNDRDKDRDSKDRDRREKRNDLNRDRGRYRDDKDRNSKRYDRDRQQDRHERGDRDRGRYNSTRYETDSKYETESSVRYERRRDRAGDRNSYEREHNRRDEKDGRYRRDHYERDDRRRNDHDYRDDRGNRDRRRGDRKDREKRNDFDDDYHRRTTGSRNNARDSDREREKERSGRDKDPRYNQHMYGYSTAYNYDAYSYYQQQQQYYEQLRRTNPQAYAEWYRKYYAGHMHTDTGTTDGRESVHSGRSSANNDKDRSDNLSSLNLIDGDSTTQKNALQQDSQRLTPCKFTNEHSTVSLRNGLIICVKPNYSINGITNVVKILKFAGNDSTRRLYQSFPGPLIHGSTHKKTIIEFCEEQIRLGPPTPSSLNVIRSRQNSMSSICSFGQATNKASFTLMWNLLILLLRQNGRVIEPDIAELLMKNKTQFPYEYQQTNLLSKSSSRDSVQSSSDAINLNKQESVNNENNEIVHNNNDSEDEGEPTNDGSDELDLTSKKSSLNSDDITEKFRNHLLYGNVNEALEWATENNLWGHALFLASKVDKRSHAKVMMKFANKLSLNDPLQTLYQLMSGRTPSSVTCIQDEKWGDWRPHLAMILSNTSQKPELYRKSITTLGDSLCSRGDLFGAQFCYLMAQVGFGKYSDANQDTKLLSNSANTVRLVLLGASHHKGFKEFATNEAIMMTEIYEYACTLNDEKFSIAEFQLYKYLLATRMLDYGYQLRTLMYMEQIALHIQRDPSKYEPTFIEQVYNLADRLKFYDPVLEKTIDDQLNLSDSSPTHQQQQSIDGSTQFEEQKWIQDLRNILNEYNSENSQLIQQQIDTNNYSVGGALDRTNIDQQFAEINQQFNALNSQYNNYDPIQQQQSLTSQNYIQTGFDDKQQQQLLQPDMTHVDQTQYTQQQQFYNPNNAAIIPQQQQQQPDSSISYDPNNAGYQQQPPSYDQQQPQNYGLDQQNQGFDYWGQSQQNEPTKPTITLPNSISNKPGFYDDDDDKTNLKPNQSNTLGAGPLTQKKSIKDNKNRSSNSTSTNSGWFGGIWNKLSMKPKNQMILPDDKNPAIVWDADKKKWVNTDGDDDGSESFKPPPKMSDLTGNNNNSAPPSIMSSGNPQQQFNQPQMYGAPLQTQQPQQQDIPTASSPGPSNLMSAAQSTEILSKTPSLQSNMFKMQRNRTLKKSYVDVFNPPGAVQSSKPTDPVLAPTLPPASIPQTGFFIPAPADDSQQQQLPQEGAPQFYNPNQYSGYQQ